MYRTGENKIFETNAYIGHDPVYVSLSDRKAEFVKEDGSVVNRKDIEPDEADFEICISLKPDEVSDFCVNVLEQLGSAIQEAHGLASGFIGFKPFPDGTEMFSWGFLKLDKNCNETPYIPSLNEIHNLLWAADNIIGIAKRYEDPAGRRTP